MIISENTAGMLLIDKILRGNGISTDLVPAPPEYGTVCAIAVRIKERDLYRAKQIINENNLIVAGIFEDRKLKLQGLVDKKLGVSVSGEFLEILEKIEAGEELDKKNIVYLLSTEREKEVDAIFGAADRIRKETVGDTVEIRGAIEFSNYCLKNCKYCGINASNHGISRYRMSEEEILEVAGQLRELGLKTVILQSGEDVLWSTGRVVELVKAIKKSTGMRITLSVGEKSREEYEALKNAGADNFLLKIEATNRKLFESVHPDDNYENRLRCSKWLKELGYINGSGNIIGLPGQTVGDIADDILYFKDMGISMIGIGPFIPALGTQLEKHPHGDIGLTLRTVAVTRIVCKKVYIPSTTALASLCKDAQVRALKSGANTIMLINTPQRYRESYRIYDNKNMVDLEAAIEAVEKAGRKLPGYLEANAYTS